MNPMKTARHNMIDGQLEPNRVLDERIVAAMGITPRERFVPEIYRQSAYLDDNIMISAGRCLMKPMVLARLLQAGALAPEQKVLVVAGGTGYSAAVLAQLGCHVTVVEEMRELADYGRAVLADLAISHVQMHSGALHTGWSADAPYDVILIDGAVTKLPMGLCEQLKPAGRLLLIENAGNQTGLVAGMGCAVVYTKTAESMGRHVVCDAAVPVIPAFGQEAGFEF